MKKRLLLMIAIVLLAAALVSIVYFCCRPEQAKQIEQPSDAAQVSEDFDPNDEEQTEQTDEVGQTDASGNPVQHTGGLQYRPTESMEVEIEEPEYVYLPQQETDNDNLIFDSWVTEREDGTQTEEPSGKYQDVTNVENAIAIPSVYGKAGETITASVKLCGQLSLCAFDLRVTYDTDLLKFVDYKDANDDLLVHCDEETGTVRMNFLRTVNLQDALRVCDLQFEVLTELNCETSLEVEVVEAISLDEDGEIIFCNFSIVDASVHLNEAGN